MHIDPASIEGGGQRTVSLLSIAAGVQALAVVAWFLLMRIHAMASSLFAGGSVNSAWLRTSVVALLAPSAAIWLAHAICARTDWHGTARIVAFLCALPLIAAMLLLAGLLVIGEPLVARG